MYIQGEPVWDVWRTRARSKKLVNGVLPVCCLSYFAGKPRESAAWWAPRVTIYLSLIEEMFLYKGTSHYLSPGGGGGSEDFGLNTVKYGWPLPLNDILLNWSPSKLLITFVIPAKVFAPMLTFRRVHFPFFVFVFQKKSSSTTERKKENKRKVKNKKQCRERRLEAHQLWGNLEPAETADTSVPVEWTHLFYMLSNWHCPSRFERSL